MKKIFKYLSLFAAVTMLAACGTVTNSDSSSSGSQVSVEDQITWSGIDDTVVQLGDTFDLLDGVHAVDTIDGELTVTVVDDDYFSPNYVSSYTITYRAENQRGMESVQYRTIQVVKGVNVENGTFELGKAYWSFDKPGGAATISYADQQATVTVMDAGTEAWAIQLYQTGIQFSANHTYELSFDAKSDYGRSVSGGFEDVANNYSMMVSGYEAVKLTSEFTRYSVMCTPSSDVGFVKAVIYLGQNLEVDSEASLSNPIDISIDNVRVKEVTVASAEKAPVFANASAVTVYTKEDFDNLTPVTAKDYQGNDISDNIEVVGSVPESVNAQTGMMVSYRVSDAEGNFAYVNRRVTFLLARQNEYNLINSDFDNGFQGWTKDVNQTNGTGAANFIADTAQGEVTVDITNGSTDNWHIQLSQYNVKLTAGKVYRTTVVARASVNRTMSLEISDPNNSYEKVASDLFSLTETDQTFVLEYKVDSNINAKFSLLLGGQGANQVTISYFENTEIDPSEATTVDFRTYEPYQLTNGDFKYGLYGWNKESTNGCVVNFSALEDEEVQLDVETSGGAAWHAQLGQDGKTFTSGTNYVLTLVAKATVATSVTMEVSNNNGATVIGSKDVLLGTDWQTFTLNFTPDADYTQGKVALLVGLADVSVITLDSFQVSLADA